MEAPDSLTVTLKMPSRLLLLEEVADEGVGLARAGAVADGDGAHVVFRDQRLQRAFGAPAISFLGSSG